MIFELKLLLVEESFGVLCSSAQEMRWLDLDEERQRCVE